ncbi:proprotein convertase subtilisin/kexin type 4 isoform X2 [Rhinatrema bivittatum]|uniref:proprotein convertase subtilisin/kexin type 4 isoform X2 n=1 Tax=Rhinatrema bivittatum TaxID=194408 RepID=UPI00112DA73B|nr:proprotein convertase subtilisin/kexin type 4 isoform X2 [Rhinatrema bivittatum]
MRPLALLCGLRLALALEVYTNSWAVRIPGGASEAGRIARKQHFSYLGPIFEGSDYYHLQHRGVTKKSFNPHRGQQLLLKKEPRVHWFEQQTLKRRKRRFVSVVPTDPWFYKQWYMNNDVSPDLNVLSAWSTGYTGKGVVVTVLDDGIEKDHPDLVNNYDSKASYDFNGNDPDPQPRYSPSNENRHGTRCAGEVAGVANNGICGTGIAYNAKIGGVRMLDGIITDIIEAKSLSLKPQHIHIYSASWGPEDDGKTVDGPGILAMEAFYRGTANGREGLGSLFVWASGNGGFHYDNCNCDGYTNSIYTLSVGSTTERGEVPWYSEACASILTTTYSSGVKNERQIVTTDVRHRCTDRHTGTSASAPLAAAIIALALEANPALTWRDMQHLVVRSSNVALLKADDWVLNGVGRKVSHHYGYGLLDANIMVNLAKKWETVRPQRRTIATHLVVHRNVTACAGTPNSIRSLEHVQARITLSYSRRGDLEISLTSPMGTKSVLVDVRPYDTSTKGYRDWSFMSTHSWDEDPQGVWSLELRNKGDYNNNGFLFSFILQLYGTEENMMEKKISSAVMGKCLKWNMKDICEACQEPFYAFKHLCLSYCPPKYYRKRQIFNAMQDGSQMFQSALVCAPCHPSCYTCNDNSAHNCTACPPFSSFDEQMHSCSQPLYPRHIAPETGPKQIHHIAALTAIVVCAPVAMFFLLTAVFWLFNRFTLCRQSHVSSAEIMTLHTVSEDEVITTGNEGQGFLPMSGLSSSSSPILP